MDEHQDRPGTAATLARKLATARNLPAADLMLVAVCWLMLGTASLLVALLPSRRILRALGPDIGAVTHGPAIDLRQQGRVQRIALALAVAARNAPFRADCYPQALTAAQLCRWFAIPHAVQLGARFAPMDGDRPGKLEGHAWVSSGPLTVCGGAGSVRAFGTVACFVHVPRSARTNAVG